MKKLFLLASLIAVVIASTGCAGVSQVIAAKEQSTKVAVQAANDNIVEGIKDATCALPYGTLLRHPEIQSAAQTICANGADSSKLLPAK